MPMTVEELCPPARLRLCPATHPRTNVTTRRSPPLYALVDEQSPRFLQRLEADEASLPQFVKEEFEAYLECGRLEYGFLRVKCDACRHERLVAFSCKHRGSCPSCGARRMAETAAHLVENVLPEQRARQWVLSIPYPLRTLFATRPAVLTQVLGIVYRAISTFLVRLAPAPITPDTTACSPRTSSTATASFLTLSIKPPANLMRLVPRP